MTKEKARNLLIQIFNTYSNIITVNYKDGVIQEAFEMAVEALADRKTENSSEKPNNSTCSKMEQVDKDINVRSKDEPQKICKYCNGKCSWWVDGDCMNDDCRFKPKDELQTDCDGCKFVGTYDTEFPCANCSRKIKDYYAKDEPQTERKDK